MAPISAMNLSSSRNYQAKSISIKATWAIWEFCKFTGYWKKFLVIMFWFLSIIYRAIHLIFPFMLSANESVFKYMGPQARRLVEADLQHLYELPPTTTTNLLLWCDRLRVLIYENTYTLYTWVSVLCFYNINAFVYFRPRSLTGLVWRTSAET